MEQENGGNTLTPPPPEVSSSMKRKRGRPRKEQSEKRSKKSRTAEPTAVSNDDGVGQEVTGVVNAAFDAGYLITVRIGTAGTVYSGVVFKPGNYIPLSSEIDVAPNVKMIRRNEILTERNHRGRRPKQRYGDEDDESVPVAVRDYGGDLRNGDMGDPRKGKETYNNDNVDSVVVAGGGKSEETDDDDDVDDDDNSDTVSAEPLQIVHSDSISSRSSNMGRMSELLQVLQRENEEGDGDDEKKKKI